MSVCTASNAMHKIIEVTFFMVKICSPKKYQVRGMNTIFPMPKAINRIDHRESNSSYMNFVPNAKESVVKGATHAAIIRAFVAFSSERIAELL